MTTQKWTKTISITSAIMVALLALGSFALSYNALWEVAYNNGIPRWGAYVWPLLIDAALVIFSIAVVRAYLYSEQTWWPWLLVGVFTLWTIVFNLVHAGGSIGSIWIIELRYLVGVIPPVALVLSFETLMNMLKKHVRRAEIVQSLEELLTRTEQEQDKLANLIRDYETTIQKYETRVHNITDNLDQVNKEIEVKRRTLDTIGQPQVVILGDKDLTNLGPVDRQPLITQLLNQDIPEDIILKTFDISAKTLGRDIKALNGQVK